MVSPELVSMIVGGARFKNKILFHDMSDNNEGIFDRLFEGMDVFTYLSLLDTRSELQLDLYSVGTCTSLYLSP